MIKHPCNAIVFLGFSGVGKDTQANLLAEDFTEVVNAKFGMVNKMIVADMFDVPPSMLEDHQWRTTAKLRLYGKQTNVTALDMLTVLFKGSKGTSLEQEHLTQTLAWCEGSIPVFTDVRRVQEFDAVVENYNPLVIYLSRNGIKPGVNDGDIAEVWRYAQSCPGVVSEILFMHGEETIAETNIRIKKLINNYVVTTAGKPILHIYISKSFNHALTETLTGSLPSYEPLGKLASALAKVGLDFGIDVHGFNAMFSAAIFNADWKNFELAPLTTSSTMIWNDAHEHFLPQLRKMADLKVHVLDEEKQQYAVDLFTLKEID